MLRYAHEIEEGVALAKHQLFARGFAREEFFRVSWHVSYHAVRLLKIAILLLKEVVLTNQFL